MSHQSYWTTAPPRSPYEIYQHGNMLREGAFTSPASHIWPYRPLPSYGLARGMAPPVPNMLPLAATTQSPWSGLASYPPSRLPYADQFSPILPHFGLRTAPSQMNDTMADVISPRTRAFPTRVAPWNGTFQSPIEPFTVQAEVDTGQRQSRLPLDSTARKAPRKACAIPTSDPPDPKNPPPRRLQAKEISGRVAKPKSRRKKEKSLATTSRSKLPNRATSKRARKPARSKQNNATTSSGVMLEEDDEDSDVRTLTVRSRQPIQAEDEPTNSIQPTIEREDVIREAQWRSQTPPAPEPQPIELTSTVPSLNHQPRGPLPRCKCDVPEALQGVQKAMGPDNWNEYLVLLEKLWMGEIHGEDFAVASRALFRIFDDKLRMRINSLVMRDMIKPGLEKYMAETARAEADKTNGMADKTMGKDEADKVREQSTGKEKDDGVVDC
ncbi:hypothetical protein IAQ61_010823 [Plenodomus lingam]|uniref:uncharacterized protein n=1 Tax=Leptosphaeria maculans TaxID=5022 RepID=UPI003322187C|nr:hypothetical protein IAQ61_010823 [Plenodomus lingam]